MQTFELWRRHPHGSHPPERLGAVVACGLALGWAAGCAQPGDSTAPAAADSLGAARGKIVNVEVTVAEPQTFHSSLRLTGVVAAEHDAVVAAEEPGVLERFLVDKGARVKRGQAIAKLDDTLLRAQVAEAVAARRLAEETHERQRRLWEGERIGSEINYLRAKHEAERAAAGARALETRLARATIRAPFAGVFDDRLLDPGEMAAPGTPVARVISMDQLKVVAGAPERYAGQITRGSEAQVTFDVLPGTVLDRQVSFVSNAIDTRNRTLTVEIPLGGNLDRVRPAMVANVQLITDAIDNVIVLPQNAVHRVEHGHQVYTARADGEEWTAEAVDVVVGSSGQNAVVISEGIQAGDRVITTGSVDTGDRVRVLAEHDQAAAGASP